MKTEGATVLEARLEEAHHERLRKILELGREPPGERRRSYLHQRPRRELEREVRREAVLYRRLRIIDGGTAGEVARELGCSRRTLCEWDRRERADGLRSLPRGRPLLRSSPWDRNRVIAALEFFGPGIGRGTWRWFWPEMPRSEVEDLVRRYRRLYMLEHTTAVHELHWLKPGSVWAMDHARPPGRIDGYYQAIFAVRDIASGAQLLWLPLEDETAGSTIRALDELRREHGLPLALKSDQGPAFRSDVMAEYLRSHGVTHLLSPPYRPQYNGACEASIGWMKARTRYQAARRGSTKEWSSDDLEAARILSNETPRAPSGRAPEDLWREREAITPQARGALEGQVAREIAALRGEQGLGGAFFGAENDEIQREAITRALGALGILYIRRREIPLPKKLIFRAKIS